MQRVTIIQGEYRVVAEPGVVISTLLGSCVAACLHDPVARVGGMNHFLLPEPGPSGSGPQSRLGAVEQQRYGVHAMELLINAMMQRGAARGRMRAHLYGGATIIAGLGQIGNRNAVFARDFMATEGIDIVRSDLGGVHARKVEFMPFEGRARSAGVADVPAPVTPPRCTAPAGGEVELF